MTRGFQPDPINEHALLTELAALVAQWQQAEQATLNHARTAIDNGARARIIADALHMSKPTLYRWMRETHKSGSTPETEQEASTGKSSA